MTTEIAIRRAHANDLAGVGRLLDRLDELHREALPWMIEAQVTQARSPVAFEAWIDANAVFVAEHDGAPVGIAHGTVRSSPALPIFVPQRRGVIDGLVVDPDWRRRGVGKRLVHAIEAWAMAEGAAWVELNVYDFNGEARRFYESLGYAPLRTILRKPCHPGD